MRKNPPIPMMAADGGIPSASMRISLSPVLSLRMVGPEVYVLEFRAPELARQVLPGQFVNIKVNTLAVPLLRRPFSVYRTLGESVEILFGVAGAGTEILSRVRTGDMLDVLGPLGCSYGLEGDFETALLVGGGLGVAPFPLVTEALQRAGRTVRTFLGARSARQIFASHLVNVEIATDDGSAGVRGTVVELLRGALERGSDALRRPKIFACGPNPMLKALAALAAEKGIACEVSLESAMACGIGICQGCPVETTAGGEKKYALICKEGTVFDTRAIEIP